MIEREFKFRDFKEAMEFVNKVAAIAEEEGHHPNIYLYSWNKVRLELYTHAIGGLHENLGAVSDKEVWSRYAQSLYFLTTSLHEGFCLPNLEAMIAGCAVITTDCDGIRDYAVDGQNCLIVSRDDPREMVEAVRRLEFDRPLRERITKNMAEQTSQQWGWQPVLSRLDRILRT